MFRVSSSSMSRRLLASTARWRWNHQSVIRQQHQGSVRYLASSAPSTQRLDLVEHSSIQQKIPTNKSIASKKKTAGRSMKPALSKRALRKTENRYKNAARSIPYWLGNDADCYAWTMEALQLNPNGKDEQYRQIYLDSLASFYERVLVADDSPPKPEIQSSLQTLVDHGFDDLQFAKSFRKMKIYHNNRTMMEKRMKRKGRQHQERTILLEELQLSLATLEQVVLEYNQRDYEEEDEEEEEEAVHPEVEENNEKEDSFLNSLVGRFQSMFGTVDFNMDDISNQNDKAHLLLSDEGTTPTSVRKRRMDRKVIKQTRQVKRAQEGVAASQQQLDWLQQEYDALEPTVSAEEYDAIMIVVKQLLLDDICPALAEHISNRYQRMIEQYQTLDSKTDLTKPHEWFMHARLDKRRIVYHGGPTNSGKTYTALQRLKMAKTGLYVGPLRLLAAEVYETLTAQGVYTNLFTGQETRTIPFATHTAATVELALQVSQDYDVVVIDEIQMMADKSRGFAWTKALLGARCKEIHVCGGLEALALVKKIAKDCGDEFVLQKYERFSPLTVADTSMALTPGAVGSYQHVRPGDCVVAFSRADIFAIKREIENTTSFKCCIIYGSLPPETRADQARRFNNPDSGYDILVASDAIGMGLNLNIRRIIFNSIFKSNGETIIRLDHSSVKQIAGRAGRRNSPYPEGQVTCRDPRDMEYLHKCMSTEIKSIPKAGLLPTEGHIELFSEALLKYGLVKSNHDEKNLHKILVQFSELATLKGDFFLCRQTPMRTIARFLTDLDMDLRDKYTLCMAPISSNNERSMTILRRFAVKHSQGEVSGLSRSASVVKEAKSFDDLGNLCEVHAEVELFLWLHNRFPGNVMEQQSAISLKERAITFINRGLQETEELKMEHCYVKRDARLRSLVKKNEEKQSEDDLVGGDYFNRMTG